MPIIFFLASPFALTEAAGVAMTDCHRRNQFPYHFQLVPALTLFQMQMYISVTRHTLHCGRRMNFPQWHVTIMRRPIVRGGPFQIQLAFLQIQLFEILSLP